MRPGKVSPILANVYLHYALDLWFARRFGPGCGGEHRLIRSADDSDGLRRRPKGCC